MVTILCEGCGQTYGIGDWPFCPHGVPLGDIIGDDIPGGIEIKHGICNEDGSPRRFGSVSEIRRAAFEKGLFLTGGDTPKVNHKLKDQAAERHYERERKAKEGSY